MMTKTRRWPLPVLVGLALGTLLLPGCASASKSDPPALAPASPPPSAWQPPARAVVASSDELEPQGFAVNSRERENPMAQRLTMKGFKPVVSSNATPDGRALNRRIEIVIAP